MRVQAAFGDPREHGQELLVGRLGEPQRACRRGHAVGGRPLELQPFDLPGEAGGVRRRPPPRHGGVVTPVAGHLDRVLHRLPEPGQRGPDQLGGHGGAITGGGVVGADAAEGNHLRTLTADATGERPSG
ncbi:hypothetical protein [Nonomuraea sp. NPDC023979]|uniref:hypothetical protein n=1 Tax=Nonomuraea sp. NPDC023979 TaxID=3154796 RepID=UPI0033E38252